MLISLFEVFNVMNNIFEKSTSFLKEEVNIYFSISVNIRFHSLNFSARKYIPAKKVVLYRISFILSEYENNIMALKDLNVL